MPNVPFSYRADGLVPKFDDAVPLVVFDGLCVLCSTGVRFMLARDPAGSSHFIAIQSPLAVALYRHYHLDAERFDTFMVLMDGVPYLRWAGILAAARTLPAPWRWLGQIGRLVPGIIGDRIYDVVQRNRLSWFGKRQTCLLPDARTRARMIT